MADKNHWRDSFQDQLNVDFKDWMYDSIANTLSNKHKASNFKDSICHEQITEIGKEKEPIKRKVKFSLEKKEKFRQIESKDKRVVHFLFNPNVPIPLTPFGKAYKLMREGTLEETLSQEKAQFEEYITKLTEEAEEPLVNPIKYDDSEYFTCQLSGITRLAFSTADSPFHKTPYSKYYPECVIISRDGKILATVNPKEKKNAEYNMNFVDDFRDPVLKINDDKKIQISLGSIKEEGVMILLLVREYDLTGKKVTETEFDKAWFRLSNEETNQTLDYQMIK